ncbi:beta-galactosidase [uncultured Cohaesibacter sp.]|uniref:beta-galactosidase n=1 Tax=uncultured Cohaesibacter sp. TaxID=1002546 RepID=UPI0029C8C70A|nr:beta-galactosidase [uncultured Cohaesibacter sp.]
MKLGVCYYPEHWPKSWWQRDALRMKELGIDYVRIGEFAWSRIEPKRDDFHFEWLDEAMDILHQAGLKIILGTPTATPPKWLMDEYPAIAAVDENGRTRGFGSRRHYSFSSSDYWRESRRIVEILAQRYGTHPGLVGWQTDNEYGCHDTTLSWGAEDLRAYKDWLRFHYQSAEQLNEAWGAVFWSMELNDFEDVVLPNGTVTEPNPAARLDFWRFSSDQVARYDQMQCEIIRQYSPDRWITHNFMGFVSDFDHFKLAENIDIASWDSYPIGFVEKFPFSQDERVRWAETSHPDIAPFHHDLYRAVGRGRFLIMEQQPGPVNWAPWNPVPKPGMVRLWTIEALAHGAELVSYFRWRQAHFAQEQNHAGLNLPQSDSLSPGGQEAEQVARDIDSLRQAVGDISSVAKAPVALLFDYHSHWATVIQPQGQDFRYEELAFRWYEAVRRLGQDVDFVPPGASLEGYALVLVPCLINVKPEMLAALSKATGKVLYGPRSGSKDLHLKIADALPPGPLQQLTGNRIIQSSSLRPGLSDPVSGETSGAAVRWREYVETSATILSRFANGDPALTEKNGHHYLACWPNEALLNEVMSHVTEKAGLETIKLPDHVRLRRHGSCVYAFNYGPDEWHLPQDAEPVMGSRILKAQDFAIWKSRT